ncbi:alcohol dehydrogenase [Cadophora sp. MPI-SDFR-AT-0126]|nr:alcohol dehydrogenase [Leotiomycetes sp. MPI-SDFR-AT-0126]
MKAFRFHTVAKGLELKDVPIPKPGKNQLLVQVKAAGLCHTDCNVISGKDDILFWQRPITLGHEIAGIVVELGPHVTEFKTGERVTCVTGVTHPITINDVTTSAGIGYDGGYAEYVLFNAVKTLRIPSCVSFPQAAAATDALATAYHALSEAHIAPNDKVAIIGLGGLGLSAVEIATLRGAKVYGVDIRTKTYIHALQSGASLCAKSIAKFSGVQFDAVVDFAGVGVTTAAAAKAVKPGGRVVLVGLGAKECKLSTYDFVAMGVTLKGSVGASKEEVEKVLRLVAEGKLNPFLEEIPFNDVKKGLGRLEEGTALGRLYVDPSRA